MFKKVLIANRGEIALRVLRACRELGVKTVAVHSEADSRALHVRFADEAVCIGPAPSAKSYLNIPAIIAAAEVTAADAIHPGYGFLSENAHFAELCDKCDVTFIGPTPAAMAAWGDKVTARANAARFGIPLLAGSGVLKDGADALKEAKRIGFPVILKASGGGGGRGMRIVHTAGELEKAFGAAKHEAETGFKNPDVYLERYVERPRHIEFQVLADQHGGIWTLGERECSLQRRHQKVIEEAPSPAVTAEKRQAMGEVIRVAMKETGYTSLGTVEFIMDESGELSFLEVNTRLQVEHTVTEMVTGLDLVALQIRDRRRREDRSARHPPVELPRARHRVPHQRRGPGHLRPLARAHHRVLPPGRDRCPRRLRRVRRLARPVDLRLAPREAHRPRVHAQRRHPQDAPRARRVHRHRHPDEHRSAQAPARRRRGHSRHHDDAHDRADDLRQARPGVTSPLGATASAGSRPGRWQSAAGSAPGCSS